MATWLGQAGFALRSPGSAPVLIDPYLSDSLAAKYAGARWPHIRLRPAPVTPEALPEVAAVLCTHAHTDHMDPGTLTPLLAAQPAVPVVVPRAVRDQAIERGVPPERVIGLGAADSATPADELRVDAVPAAHETLVVDEAGDHLHLGYVIQLAGVRLYHSGDCCPYPGQAELLADLDIDVALLPVNGRDAERLESGVPGNFHFEEAVDLCRDAGIPWLVPHHFGMFDFNTADPATFDLDAAGRSGVQVVLPTHGEDLELVEVR
ncbi:MBL fold metallo-hydrolase [Euzebya sp.]|uniref:MBL fold metallo-hydrolase n=1 Tax=Euzebya sp. TaxID=1971409 RepID=UPI0035153548